MCQKKLHSVNVKSRNGGAYILQLAFHPKAILIQSKHRREVNAQASHSRSCHLNSKNLSTDSEEPHWHLSSLGLSRSLHYPTFF